MSRSCWWMVLIAVAGLLPVGCARRAAPKARPAQAVQRPLPAGAPTHPSPEYLRAAKVLKPIPPEMLLGAKEAVGVPKAVLQRYTQWWPAGWEFFGTLSDEQIERVRKTKFLRVHVRDLTPKQREAFEAFMDAKDKAMAGTGNPEYRVELYKVGARADLSNVDVGFDVDGDVLVIRTWTRRDSGGTTAMGDGFATL